MELNDISGAIVNSAMLVHSGLGPGLLGLILNFNSVHLKVGIVRMVNNFPPASSPSPAVQI